MTGALQSAPSSQEKALLYFYFKADPSVQPAFLSEVVHGTEKYAKKLGLSSQVDTLLSMAHRESGFNPYADDGLGKRRSLGFYQTREQYREMLYKFWLDRKVRLGPWDSVDTQCAFGVAEFWIKLQASKGNVWEAVRRYNGGGVKAREYAAKVMISRRAIFHRKHRKGEKIGVKK
jgi:hypothetical protein